MNPEGKEVTNMCASGSDDSVFTHLEFLPGRGTLTIADELVEVTPESIRLRKLQREHHMRKRASDPMVL